MNNTIQSVRALLIITGAIALGGCDAANQKIMSADEGEVGPYPIAYREMVQTYLRNTLLDPYSVRDARISKPKRGRLVVEGTLGVHEPGWLVCFRGNAKNSAGAFTGVSDIAMLIRGDRVLTSLADPTHSHYVVKMVCEQESYEPLAAIDGSAVHPRPR
jgi:hypothetical protein